MAKPIKHSDIAWSYWKMDGIDASKVLDNTINGNVLDAIGTGTTVVDGFINNAVRVTGTSTGAATNYLRKDNILVSNSNFTMSGWFKVEPYTGSSYETYISGITTHGANGVGIAVSDGKKYSINYFDGSNHIQRESSVTVVNDWVHLALVKNGSQIKLFVNGILEVTDNITHNVGLHYLSCYNNSGMISRITYVVDELLIWRESLSDSQVQEVYSSYFPTRKVLVVNDGRCIKYDSDNQLWVTVTTSEPTVESFMNGNNHNEIESIPQSAWEQLNGIVETRYYVEDTDKKEVQFNIETEPFTLADGLGNTFSIIEYTDNHSQETSAITLETEPFNVYDYISELPVVIAYTESTEDIIVSTTTKPFEIYEEFGDTVDVLYYTDDETVTNADLVLEANWSPIDELEGDFEVVTWTDEAKETAKRVLEVDALPTRKILTTEALTSVGDIKNIITKVVKDNHLSSIKFAIQKGSSYTVIAKPKSNGYIETLTYYSKEETFDKGMTSDTVGLITPDILKEMTKDTYRLVIAIDQNIRDYGTTKLNTVEVKQSLPTATPKVESASVKIINSLLNVELDFIGSLLEGTITDADVGGKLKYKATLNGTHYYPSLTEWTDWITSPYKVFLQLQSADVVIGSTNTLIIDIEDWFGNKYQKTYTFIGEYSGLLFKDPLNGYYTSDVGEIIKYLHAGVLQQGQVSPEYEVHLVNNNPFNVKNTTLVGAANSKGVTIELSKTSMPFINESMLTWEELLGYKELKAFYIRLRVDSDADITQGGEFNITAVSEMEE